MQISANIQKKLKVATGVAGAMLASVSPVFADQLIKIAPTQKMGFFQSGQDLVDNLLKIVMIIGVLLVFVYLVLGGIEYITSGGEKGKTEAARNKITAAVVGLIILASSYAILTIAVKFITGGGSPDAIFQTF